MHYAFLTVSWVLQEQVHSFIIIVILFHSTYQDEYTLDILHTVFLYICYLDTDEDNLFNIKDLFFLLIMFCYS